MRRLYRGFVAVLLIGVAPATSAQDIQPGKVKPSAVTLPANGISFTGKERLGRKWMDEQRIDNCKVPLDKRGTKPRPSACPHVPTG
jgi:hypothetical protein